MKIEQIDTTPAFIPVTLTLESEAEVRFIRTLAGAIYPYEMPCTGLDRATIEGIFYQLNKIVPQNKEKDFEIVTHVADNRDSLNKYR